MNAEHPDHLTTHFTLREFTRSNTALRHGVSNEPKSPAILANLTRTAELLEQVRDLLGGLPIVPSSGYRSPALNRLVNGSERSAHCKGRAVDFGCDRAGTPREICLAIVDSDIAFDQLIFEGEWVHLAVAPLGETPRRAVLTAIFRRHQPVRYVEGIV